MASNYELLVPLEEMVESATLFSKDSDEMDSVIQELQALMSQLEANWEGAAEQSYAGKFNALCGKLQEARRPMNDAVADLLQARQTYAETEQQIGGTDVASLEDVPTYSA
ncbi:MAG: WXG100 family type VII secretion target [Oscillospiraceae bacterium]|jgi:WXG100 family type VII secretion target|nr:WXG100 family type VII secretion target [Oscillospiraceae bacterium]